jgi:hypothetical protein
MNANTVIYLAFQLPFHQCCLRNCLQIDVSGDGFFAMRGDYIGWTSEQNDRSLISYDASPNPTDGAPSYYYQVPVTNAGPQFPEPNTIVQFDELNVSVVFSLAVRIDDSMYSSQCISYKRSIGLLLEKQFVPINICNAHRIVCRTKRLNIGALSDGCNYSRNLCFERS